MTNQVTIVKNSKNGQVFTPGTTSEFGFYIVEVATVSMEGGFIREDKRTAILSVENTLGEKLNYSEGKKIDGQIIRLESKTPMWAGQKAVINPKSGDPILRGGSPVYRKDEFTADLSLTDDLVARDAAKQPVSAGLAK